MVMVRVAAMWRLRSFRIARRNLCLKALPPPVPSMHSRKRGAANFVLDTAIARDARGISKTVPSVPVMFRRSLSSLPSSSSSFNFIGTNTNAAPSPTHSNPPTSIPNNSLGRGNHDHNQKPIIGEDEGVEPYDPFLDPPMEIVKQLADDIRSSVRSYIQSTSSSSSKTPPVKLIAITASRTFTPQMTSVDTGTDTYSEWISRTCKEDGIQFETWRVAGGRTETASQIQNLIRRVNASRSKKNGVTGVLVCYPIYSDPFVLGWDDGKDYGSVSLGRGNGYDNCHISSNSRQKYHWSMEMQQKRMEDSECLTYLQTQESKWPSMKYKTRDDYFRQSIDVSKDVEGLSHAHSNRRLFRNPDLYVDRWDGSSDTSINIGSNVDKDTDAEVSTSTSGGNNSEPHEILFPCTALAVVQILKRCLPPNAFDPSKPIGRRFENLTVTVINRSQILGRPLASMLANDGARVYSVDKDSIMLIQSDSNMNGNGNTKVEKARGTKKKQNRCFAIEKSVESCIRESSIIVTGVPSSTYKIPAQWIQPHSTVINVASEPNVNEDELREIPGLQYIGQIGKVTVALLEHNLIRLHQMFQTS